MGPQATSALTPYSWLEAKEAGLHVVATAASADLDYVRSLGAGRVVDYHAERFEELLSGYILSLISLEEIRSSGRFGF